MYFDLKDNRKPLPNGSRITNEMGVYLIGPEKLDNIGEELIKIAGGKNE